MWSQWREGRRHRKGGEDCFSTFRRSFSASSLSKDEGLGWDWRRLDGCLFVCLPGLSQLLHSWKLCNGCSALIWRTSVLKLGAISVLTTDCSTTLHKENDPEQQILRKKHKLLIGPKWSCSIKKLAPSARPVGWMGFSLAALQATAHYSKHICWWVTPLKLLQPHFHSIY